MGEVVRMPKKAVTLQAAVDAFVSQPDLTPTTERTYRQTLAVVAAALGPVTSFRAETYGSQAPSRRAESCQADEPVHKAGGPDSKVTCPLGNREERGTKACSGAVGPRGVTDIQVETVGSYSKGAREN